MSIFLYSAKYNILLNKSLSILTPPGLPLPLIATLFMSLFTNVVTFCLEKKIFQVVSYQQYTLPQFFLSHFIQSVYKWAKKLVVSCDAAFPEPLLYSCSFGKFSEKGFIVVSISAIILACSGRFFFMWLGFRSRVISSFFVIPRCSNNIGIILVRNEWLSAHRFHADIELVIDEIPVRWLAVSTFLVYSSARSIDPDKKHFFVLLSEKHLLWNSLWTSGWVILMDIRFSLYFVHHFP